MTTSSLVQQDLRWTGLGKILSEHVLEVPAYQRAYAWQLNDVDDFWLDINRAISEGQPEYFMGPLVIAGSLTDNSPKTVIDGQQRLATATILINLLRLRHLSDGDQITAHDIEREYLRSHDRRSRRPAYKLTLSRDDRQFFQELIFPPSNSRPTATRESHQLLDAATTFLQEQLDEYLPDDPTERREALITLEEYIKDKTLVMLAVVPSAADAHAIFETLNARGAELAISDLMKNHLFAMSSDSLNEVMHFWNQAVSVISEVDEQSLPAFLHHNWISRHDHVRRTNLYRVFRTAIRNRESAERSAAELESSSRTYREILSPRADFWNAYGPSAYSDISILNTFRLAQNRPMLMALLDVWEDSERIAITLTSLVGWSLRGIVVGGIGEGRTEVAYTNVALKLRRGEIESPQQLLDELRIIVPGDVAFGNAMRSYSPPTNYRAHYMLRALELSLGELEPQEIPNPDRTILTLEHVLPRNPSPGDWDVFTDDEKPQYTKRLGNLCLVPRTENIRLGNKPFSVKQPVLAEMNLSLTNIVGEQNEWTTDTIDGRQRQLAQMAIEVWPDTVVTE